MEKRMLIKEETPHQQFILAHSP